MVIWLVFWGACFGKCFYIPIFFGPWAPGTKGPLGVNSLSSFPGIHLSHMLCAWPGFLVCWNGVSIVFLAKVNFCGNKHLIKNATICFVNLLCWTSGRFNWKFDNVTKRLFYHLSNSRNNCCMGERVELVVLGRLPEFRDPTETVHSQGYSGNVNQDFNVSPGYPSSCNDGSVENDPFERRLLLEGPILWVEPSQGTQREVELTAWSSHGEKTHTHKKYIYIYTYTYKI